MGSRLWAIKMVRGLSVIPYFFCLLFNFATLVGTVNLSI